MKATPTKSSKFLLIGVFTLITTMIIVFGHLYYKDQYETILKNEYKELESVANFKVSQINYWRKEKISDAEILFNNANTIQSITDFIANSDQAKIQNNLKAWFKVICLNLECNDVYIFDTTGKPIFSLYEQAHEPLSEDTRVGLKEVLISKKVTMTGIELVNNNTITESRKLNSNNILDSVENKKEPIINTNINVNILIPILQYSTTGLYADSSTTIKNKYDKAYKPKIIAIALLKINPNHHLYPLIRAGSEWSKTSETLLLKQHGNDSIIYLNELRHYPNSALRLVLSKHDTMLLASKALNGFTGITEGVDYLNHPVIGCIFQIPESDWYMIAKVDKGEVYNPVRRQTTITIVGIVLFALLNTTIFLLINRHRQYSLYVDLYKTESKNLELTKRYELLAEYANDIILQVDSTGRIIEANRMAATAYGYSQSEMQSMSVKNLISEQDKDSLEYYSTINRQTEDKIGVFFESQHRRKNGNKFPVEVSSRFVTVNGEKVFVQIIRDISDRKNHENELIRAKSYYKHLLDEFPDLIWRSGTDGLCYYFNSTWLKFRGRTLEQEKGNGWTEGVHPDDIEFCVDYYTNAFNSRIPFVMEYRILNFLGEYRWIIDNGMPIVNSEGQFDGYIGACIDITDTKNNEIKLQRLNRVYSVLSNINKVIVRLRDKNALYQEACNIAVRDGGFKCALIGIINKKKNVIEMKGINGLDPKVLKMIETSLTNPDKFSLSPIIKSIQSGTFYACNDIANETPIVLLKEMYLQHEINSIAAFPILVHNTLEGFIAFFSEETNIFDSMEINLLAELSNDITFALESIDQEEKRHEAESKLLETNEKLETIVRYSPLPIITLNLDIRITGWNPASQRLLGWTSEEASGKQFPIEPQQRYNEFLGIRNRILLGESTIKFESKHNRKDGSLVTINIFASPIYDSSENVNGILLIMDDITQKKADEERILEDQRFIKQITEVVPLTIYIYDIPTQHNIYINRKLAGINGFTDQKLLDIDNQLLDYIYPDDKVIINDTLNKYSDIPDNFTVESEYRVKDADDNWRWVHTWETVFKRDENDRPIQIIGVAEDISGRKESELLLANMNKELEDRVQERTEQLEKAMDNLLSENTEKARLSNELLYANDEIFNMLTKEKELNELKSRFVSMISHELRTPLSGIKGGVDNLKNYYDRMTADQLNEYFSDIQRSADSMIKLLNDVLMVSKAEAKKIIVNYNKLNISQICSEIIRELNVVYPDKIINFNSNQFNIECQSDDELIRSILNNLLSNGIKYSPQNEPVNLSLQKTISELIITVEDHGIGIPEDDCKSLFQLFHRAKNVRNIQGTGLGLSIVKSAVDSLGGKIEFKTELNVGTVFKVFLPLSDG